MRLIDADALWMDIIHSMDYCDDFLSFIDAAPTIPQWIPCSERLPEMHGEEYLVTLSDGYTSALQYDVIHRRWYLSFLADGEVFTEHIDGVIAWMPLPEPWKEDDK